MIIDFRERGEGGRKRERGRERGRGRGRGKKLISFPSLLEKRQSPSKELEVRLCLVKILSSIYRV